MHWQLRVTHVPGRPAESPAGGCPSAGAGGRGVAPPDRCLPSRRPHLPPGRRRRSPPYRAALLSPAAGPRPPPPARSSPSHPGNERPSGCRQRPAAPPARPSPRCPHLSPAAADTAGSRGTRWPPGSQWAPATCRPGRQPRPPAPYRAAPAVRAEDGAERPGSGAVPRRGGAGTRSAARHRRSSEEPSGARRPQPGGGLERPRLTERSPRLQERQRGAGRHGCVRARPPRTAPRPRCRRGRAEGESCNRAGEMPEVAVVNQPARKLAFNVLAGVFRKSIDM